MGCVQSAPKEGPLQVGAGAAIETTHPSSGSQRKVDSSEVVVSIPPAHGTDLGLEPVQQEGAIAHTQGAEGAPHGSLQAADPPGPSVDPASGAPAGSRPSVDPASARSSFALEAAPAQAVRPPATLQSSARGDGSSSRSVKTGGSPLSQSAASKRVETTQAGISGNNSTSFESSTAPSHDSNRVRQMCLQAADAMGVAVDPSEAPKPAPLLAALPDPLPDYQPKDELGRYYSVLGVLLPDVPVPLAVFKKLWQLKGSTETLQVAMALSQEGILRLAKLEDGSTWALPDAKHCAHSAACWQQQVHAAHSMLLACYLDETKTLLPAAAAADAVAGEQAGDLAAAAEGATAKPPQHGMLASIRDDGYILKALPHHLMGSDQSEELHALLMDLRWLEAKVYAYGTGSVVADFRRYLQGMTNERAETAHSIKLVLQALQLSLSNAMHHPTTCMLREQLLARLLAVSQSTLHFKVWYEEQLANCAADRLVEVGNRLVHLVPKSASLQQAGGIHRMTLVNPTQGAPMCNALILPNGTNVVTTSATGVAQLWDMNVGDCVMDLVCSSQLTAEAVTPDGTLVLLGAADGTACIWDLAAGRAAHVMRGHSKRITALAVDKQGLRCVTTSEDGTGRVWSLCGAACEAVLVGHGAGGMGCSLLDVCISSDGTLAVTVSDDFCGRVWDLDEDGECLHTLEGHAGWVTSCAFIGTSQQVVTASHDTTARIWDALKGRCLMVLAGHTGRINQVVVDVGGNWAVTCSDDFTARVWDAESGKCLQVLNGHESHVNDAAISKDGKTLVTVSGDHRGAVWDLATGKRRTWLEGHSGEVRSVTITQRGRFAITCSVDGSARVWDLLGQAISLPACHTARVSGVQALPGGRLVVSAGDDGRVLTWDVGHGVCLRQHDGHGVGVRFMRVATDGKHVVTGSGDRKICKWNWESYNHSLTGPWSTFDTQELFLRTALGTLHSSAGLNQYGDAGASNDSLRSSSDTPEELFNALAAVGLAGPSSGQQHLDGSAVTAGPLRRHLKAPTLPDSTRGESGASVNLFPATTATTTTGTDLLSSAANSQGMPEPAAQRIEGLLAALQADPLRTTLPAQQGSRVKHIAFDAACRFAAVLLFDSTVGVWDIDSGGCVQQLIKRGERDASRTHSGGVNAVYLTNDASRAVTISKDCTARVWDVASGNMLFVVQGHTDGIVVADISPNQSLLATGAYDKTVRIASMGPDAAGNPRGAVKPGTVLAVLDHPAPATHLAFSPDGRRLAVALEDNSAVIWDLHARRCLPPLAEHTAAINAVAWSPDGKYLLTGGQDCTLRVWRATDGGPHVLYVADAAVTSCCCASSSSGAAYYDTIVIGDANGMVHFLDFKPEMQRQ